MSARGDAAMACDLGALAGRLTGVRVGMRYLGEEQGAVLIRRGERDVADRLGWFAMILEDALETAVAEVKALEVCARPSPPLPLAGPSPAAPTAEDPCAVCGLPFAPDPVEWVCDRCPTRMHDPCYWGRVATIEAWRAHEKQNREGPEDYVPVVLCPTCRAAEGAS